MSADVLSTCRRLRSDRRVSALLAAAFLGGAIPLVLAFLVTGKLVVSRFLTWALPVVPLLAFGTVDLLAAVDEMRSLPDVDDWGWEKRTRVWIVVVFERHYTLKVVVTLLYGLSFIGVFLLGPAGFPAVAAVAGWTTLLALPAITPYAFGDADAAELEPLG